MTRSMLALFFCSLLVFTLSAQDIIPPTFEDVYSLQVKELEGGNTNIDYRAFRESFLESQQFRVANERASELRELTQNLYEHIDKRKHEDVISTAKKMLCIDYTSMRAHKALQQAYKIAGDSLNHKKYHDIEFGLLRSIVQNGDGSSCETGWPVIQIEEEYFILDMKGAELEKQQIEGVCDKMTVRIDGKKKVYYFDAYKIFESYQILKQ